MTAIAAVNFPVLKWLDRRAPERAALER